MPQYTLTQHNCKGKKLQNKQIEMYFLFKEKKIPFSLN
jgi:hypothetical protein